MTTTAPPRSRPGLVTAAAIVLIVFGALGTIFGLLGLPLSFAYTTLGGIGILFVILSLLGLVVAVLALVAGIGLLTNAAWAYRLAIWVSWTAIALSVLGLVLGLVFAGQLTSAFGVEAGAGATAAAGVGGIFGVVIAVAIYGFVLWALNREKGYFTA